MFTKLLRRARSKTPRAAAGRVRTKPACRPRVELLEDRCLLSGNVVLEWNQLALNAIGQTRTNPLLASRALAITQAAVYDSVNAIDRSFEPYFAHVHASRGASLKAAAAQAAHDTLSALFPGQASVYDAALAADLVGIPPGLARQGTEVGHAVAQQILTWRSTDGSTAVVPYTPGTNPGDWQPTPPAFLPALGPQWPQVTPFAMTGGAQFRPGAPPALDSAEYAAAFDEVKDLGRVDSSTRTADQTQIAFFWRDATGTSYAFGHWNTIAQGVSAERGLDLVADARLFALLNIATADAIISCWDAKYTYNFWRPVTAIRAADTDGNPDTAPDASWTPLIVTPNFSSYTSAHSTVSSAAATVLTSLFGPGYHFTVGSEGLAGVTRSFAGFDMAAAEAGQSRIYGGIHFQFDNQRGLASGHALGQFVVGNVLLTVEHGDRGSSHDGDHTAGQAALGADELALLAGASITSPGSRGVLGGQQDSAPATGQPTPKQAPRPTDVPAARALEHRVLDQALADLDESLFADPLQRDEVFVWTR